MHFSAGAAGGGDSLNYVVLWMFIDTQNLKGQTDKDVKDAASIRFDVIGRAVEILRNKSMMHFSCYRLSQTSQWSYWLFFWLCINYFHPEVVCFFVLLVDL